MNETNAELEEMDTVKARDEAYERTKPTYSVLDDIDPPIEDYWEDE